MKNERQEKILAIIAASAIETQEQLIDSLRKEGISCTQATISRDIKELGLVKVSDGKKQKYARDAADSNISAKLLNMFRHAVFSIDYALNNVVIKTISGAANSAGMFVDRMGDADVMGCVAGDDTVLIITRSEAASLRIVETLKEILRS